VLMYPAAAQQVGKLTSLQPTRMTVIDLFRMGLQLEFGRLEQTCNFIVMAVSGLPVNQQGQAFFKAQFRMCRRLRQLLLQPLHHAGQS